MVGGDPSKAPAHEGGLEGCEDAAKKHDDNTGGRKAGALVLDCPEAKEGEFEKVIRCKGDVATTQKGNNEVRGTNGKPEAGWGH